MSYLNQQDGTWRGLPHDSPKWQTVYGYFRQCVRTGVWERIHDELRRDVRQQAEKLREPMAAIIDNQSVKTTEKGGYMGTMRARNQRPQMSYSGRHVWFVVSDGGTYGGDSRSGWVQARVFSGGGIVPNTISRVWAEGGYAGKLIEWVQRWCGWVIEIVHKLEGQVGFQVLPKLWLVERTFAWLGHSRRLSKDYEELTENSEAMIRIAMIRLMLQRLDRPPRPKQS